MMRYRYAILAGAVVLVLTVALSMSHRVREVFGSTSAGDQHADAALTRSLSDGGRVDAQDRSIVAAASESDSPHSARGAGYVWGKALREVFAGSTVSPEGKRHLDLDLTELQKAFRMSERPMNLEDASALPQARGEYLASVITAALDLTPDLQAEFAGVLQGYYTSDWESRELPPDEQAKRRAELSTAARDELASVLPVESEDPFRKVFAAADFLFRSMSLAADEITLTSRGGRAIAKDGVVLTLDPDGAIQFQAESSSFQSSEPAILQKRETFSGGKSPCTIIGDRAVHASSGCG